MTTRIRIIPLSALALLAACTDSDEASGPDRGGAAASQTLNLTPISGLNRGAADINSHADIALRSSLVMDFRSYCDAGKEATGADWPNYARIKRLKDGSYILFCHQSTSSNPNGFDTFYSTGRDLQNWIPGGFLFERYAVTNSRGVADKRVFTNANGIVLRNGDLLAFASYRANAGYSFEACRLDHGIILKRSTDNGLTWSEPQEIYHGPNWEAHMLQLPSGQIQCYFSESRPWISGGHSGTSMIVSDDNGLTWSPAPDRTPLRVIRQHWFNSDKQATFYTDQMPVIIRLNGSDRLAASLESARSASGGKTTYALSLAYSDEQGRWTPLEGDQTGPADRQNYLFEGAAPFLVQFPSGETVLSNGLSSHLQMRMGDAEARRFGEPFPALPGRGSWGSMELDDDHTLIAAMRNSEDPAAVVVSLARFRLNHRITATRRSVAIDGDNAEWAETDQALFVGSRSQAQATLRCSCDQGWVYFLVEVLDEAIARDDYVNILLSPANEALQLTSEARRIKISHRGLRSTDVWAGGWHETPMGVRAQAALDGTEGSNEDTDHGYLVEVAVPRSEIGIVEGETLVNLVLFDTEGGEDAICPSSSRSIASWVPVAGL